MRELTPAELLRLYESGSTEAPLERAVGILAAACPETNPDQIAALSAGRRDGLLLELRALNFGPRAECVAECPTCGSELEFALELTDIASHGPAAPRPDSTEIEGFEIRLRLPDTRDLMAASATGSVEAARAVLLERCVAARRGQEIVAARDLPAQLIAAIVEEMSRLDPQADVLLALRCAACGHAWDAPFDISSFLWNEIQQAARKLLRGVHVLASAYGWSEADILSLSPWRRQAYLGMVTE